MHGLGKSISIIASYSASASDKSENGSHGKGARYKGIFARTAGDGFYLAIIAPKWDCEFKDFKNLLVIMCYAHLVIQKEKKNSLEISGELLPIFWSAKTFPIRN